MPGYSGVLAAGAGDGAWEENGHFSVKLEVRGSLGVSLDGKVSSETKAIRIGDPDTGMVSYVILDG